MDPTAREVIGRTVVREYQPTSIREDARMGRRIRQRLEDGGEWRETLAESVRRPLARGEALKHIEDIGMTFDNNPASPTFSQKIRAPGSREQLLYQRAINGEALSRKILEVGYDHPSVTNAERALVRTRILDHARKLPYLEPYIRGMTGAQQQAFAERLLRDGNYEKALKDARDGADTKTIKLEPDTLGNAQAAREELELDVADMTALKTEADAALAAARARLNLFARNAAGAPMPGAAKAIEIDALRASRAADQVAATAAAATLATAQTTLETAQRTLQVALNARPGTWTGAPLTNLEAAVRTAEGALRIAQTADIAAKAQLQKLDDLLKEQTDARTEEKEAADAQRTARRNEADKIRGLRNKRREEQGLIRVRESEEEELAETYEDVFANALGSVVIKQERDVLTKYQEEIDQRRKETSDTQKNAMLDAINQRWLGRERLRGLIYGFRRHPYRAVNMNLVNRDYRALLNDGPEALMRQVMEETLPGVRNEMTGVNYTPDQIQEMIRNREYRNAIEPDLIRQLLARKFVGYGGGVNREDVYTITMSRWGQSAIEEALQKNRDFRTGLEQIIQAGPGKEGGLQRASFFERFSQAVRRRPWLLAALFAGVPLAVAAGPLGVAGLLGVAGGEIIGAGAAAGGATVGIMTGREALEAPVKEEQIIARTT